MPNRFFLNALRTQEGSLPAPGVGEWQSDPEFLTRYARSIHLDGQLEASSLSHSVPSVFQRPIQFHAALANEKHPLHRAIRSEWRGLMAVLALSHWLGVKFTTTEFNVPQVSPEAASRVGSASIGDLHFRAALRNQLPTRHPSQNRSGNDRGARVSDWERWWVLRCDDHLLGATSPWTLVYTAAHHTAPESVPWKRNGLLTDPIAYYDPQGARQSKPPELAILHAWVRDMLGRQASWGYPPEAGAYANLLFNLLTAWAADLAPYMRPNEFKIEHTQSFFSQAPYSNILGAPLLEGEESDLFIPTKRGKVLVLHGHMAPDTRVFGSTFAYQVDVGELPAEGTEFKTRSGKLIRQPFLIAERFFFPTQLVRLSLTEQAHRLGDVSVPLPPTFFSYFDYPDLRWLSVMEVHGELTAALRLPLSNGRLLEFGHVYRKDDVLDLALQTPGLALWPDFYDESWTGNFAACAANPMGKLQVRALFRDGGVAQEMANDDPHQRQVRLWRSKAPAIGFALSLGTGTGSERSCGLVLRGQLQAPPPLENREWRVGVDFGTSSTTVMVDRMDGSIAEIRFGAHLLKLTNVSYAQQEITRNLYPDTEVIPPFRTLLYDATATQFGPGSTPFTLRFSDDVGSDFLNKPIRELKWGAQARGGVANPLNVYLEALVRYIAWEARFQGVRKVELFWSYPTSLPLGALTAMRNFWDHVSFLGLHPGMRLSVQPPMSESEAACRALAHAGAKVRTEGLTIGVDIGGGSTDIAYWSKLELLDQVSFKIAGNDMLDPSLLSSETLREIFEVCSRKRLDANWIKEVQGNPIYVSGALADAQKEVDPRNHPLRAHILQGGRENVSPWIEIRSMIYLYFTGLCYYLGAQARLLGIATGEIEVFFGGRGSTLLTWLASSPQIIQAALEHAFRIGLTRAPDDGVPNRLPPGNIVITFAGLAIAYNDRFPKLKTEVARGLLDPNRMRLTAALPNRGVLAGETGWSLEDATTRERTPLPWNARLEADDFRKMRAPSDNQFASNMIGHFISEILQEDPQEDLERLNLDAVRLRALVLRGSNVADLIGRSADGENAAQPLFAYELRALMARYAEEARQQTGTPA